MQLNTHCIHILFGCLKICLAHSQPVPCNLCDFLVIFRFAVLYVDSLECFLEIVSCDNYSMRMVKTKARNRLHHHHSCAMKWWALKVKQISIARRPTWRWWIWNLLSWTLHKIFHRRTKMTTMIRVCQETSCLSMQIFSLNVEYIVSIIQLLVLVPNCTPQRSECFQSGNCHHI